MSRILYILCALFGFFSPVYAITGTELENSKNAFASSFLDYSCKGIHVYDVVQKDAKGLITNAIRVDTGSTSPYDKLLPTLDGKIKAILKLEMDNQSSIQQGVGGIFDYTDISDSEAVSGGNRVISLNPPSGAYYELKCVAYCSKAPHPMVAPVIECLEGSFRNLFIKPLVDPWVQENSSTVRTTVFQKVQISVKPIVVLFMILFVAYTGFTMLFLEKGAFKFTLPETVILLIKIGCVSYFAIGDAWKDFFFDAMRSISYGGAKIFLDAALNANEGNIDGCMFPGNYYPKGKEHLALFDTMDCKIGNYIGYFKQYDIPATLQIAVSYLFFPPFYGFVLSALCIAYCLAIILMYARMTQMYLATTLKVILLLFLSPIMIPMCLLEKTKSIYENWLGQVQGTILPPVGVFAMIALTLIVLDGTFYGAKPNPDLFVYNLNGDQNYEQNIRQECLSYVMNNALNNPNFTYDKNVNVFTMNKNSLVTPEAIFHGKFDLSGVFSAQTPSAAYSAVINFYNQNSLFKSLGEGVKQGLDNSFKENYQNKNCIGSTIGGDNFCLTAVETFCDDTQNLINKKRAILYGDAKYMNPNCTLNDPLTTQNFANVVQDIFSGENFFLSIGAGFSETASKPIVCYFIKATDFFSIALPIPGFIELVTLPVPIMVHYVPILIIKLVMALLSILVIGFLTAQFQSVVESVFGGGDYQPGATISQTGGMTAGKAAFEYGKQQSKDTVDRLRLGNAPGSDGGGNAAGGAGAGAGAGAGGAGGNAGGAGGNAGGGGGAGAGAGGAGGDNAAGGEANRAGAGGAGGNAGGGGGGAPDDASGPPGGSGGD
jgi:hypothetical protein